MKYYGLREMILSKCAQTVSMVMRPLSDCRTLMFFTLLMCYAIKICGNLMGADTDAFLSTLLPVFDCYLLCLISHTLKKFRLGFVVPVIASVILFSELFTVFFYHSHFTIYVVLLLFETNTQESSQFVSAALSAPATWYTLLLTLLLAAASACLSRLSRHRSLLRGVLMFLSFVLIVWSGVRQASAYSKLVRCFNSGSTTVCNNPRYIPHLNTPFVRLSYGIAYNRASSAELSVLEKTVSQTSVDGCDYRCPLIVLVIGESFNKHHSPLYEPGYLMTTPRLLRQRDEGRLVVFSDAVAPFNFTSNAFKYMFTTWDDESADEWTQHTLFPVLFKQAGYCVDFYSNQFTMNQTHIWDLAGSTIFNQHGLSDLQFTHRNADVYAYDGELISQLPPADSLVARPTLLIVHLQGQHVQYEHKYPKEFARFTAADEQTPFGGEQGRRTAAHYDNATYYNDHIVDSVFQLVRNTDAIAIYLSDHGEEVYDWRDQYERTNEGTLYPEVAHYQYEIPLMFFMTDTFQVRHPETVAAVKAAAHLPFLSSDLPHVLLGLAGIRCSEYIEKRNILSPLYHRNRKRIIRNDVDYDEVIRPLRPGE